MGGGSSTSDTEGAPYSSNADDKTVHEAYLWPFYDAVKAGAGAIMCAMNKVNGTLSCENSAILQKLLKTELAFPGMVYPDVNGQSTAFGSANGGLDYGSSSIWSNTTMTAGLANGTLTEARLDDMVIRNVIGAYKVGLDNHKQPSQASAGDKVVSKQMRAQHAQLIRQQGANSMVLLKNTDNALPLKDPGVMAIFGAHAGSVMGGPNAAFSVSGSGPVYQGHLGTGTGSAAASMQYLITPQMSLTFRAAEDGSMIRYILNDTYTSTSTGGFGGGGNGGAPSGMGNSTSGPSGATPSTGASSNSSDTSGGSDSQSAINAQVQTGTGISPSIDGYAESSDTCIVFLNALAGEGADRTELTNTDQDTLVTQVASNCNNTVVVINSVGPRLMDAWIENENVTAVLYGSLLGQQSGNSIMDVLYGDVNPNGKLVYTIAKNESDYNVKICETAQCDFTEGVYIDYKYFDAKNVTPRYEFGYGLSYTTFLYGDVSVQAKAIKSGPATGVLSVGGRKDLWDELVTVSTAITNSGSVNGAEVAQLYLGYPAAADQPIRALRGFDKLSLKKGEKKQANFALRRRDISFWDTAAQEWSVAEGGYTVYVGSSSRDLRAQATFTV
jgi:beta-glucosidase